MSEVREPLSMRDQATLLMRLLGRTRMQGGATAEETTMVVSAVDVADLDHLITRLERMAPFEDGIRKLVMGRR